MATSATPAKQVRGKKPTASQSVSNATAEVLTLAEAADYLRVSTDETLGVFAAIAGCKGERTATPYPSRNPKGGTRAILERDATCKVPVELVKIEGGGHNIPGPGRNIAPASGPHNADVDAARLIFEFFARLKGA